MLSSTHLVVLCVSVCTHFTYQSKIDIYLEQHHYEFASLQAWQKMISNREVVWLYNMIVELKNHDVEIAQVNSL
jgi:hypothetical protein